MTETNIDNLDMEQIENLKIEKQKELANSLRNEATVQDLQNTLKKDQIRVRKEQLEISEQIHNHKSILDKSKYNIRIMRTEIKTLEERFWQLKQGF